MFGIGGTEIIVIALIAMLLLGPDKIPQVARKIGKLVTDFKRYQATMESVIKAEMYGDENAADQTLTASEPSAKFQDDDDDEEEEE